MLLLALLVPALAAAQAREPRVFVTVGGGAQTGGGETRDRLEWRENVENATADVDYGAGARSAFVAGAGVRIWRQLGAGIALSRASRQAPAAIDARIPHPFFFEQPRPVEGQTADLTRTETGVHLQLLYLVPARGRLHIILSGGPSRIEVRQDAVTAVRYTEDYPFDTAVFQRADTRSISDSAVGFNAGAEAAFMFSRVFGVAGMMRFTRATLELARPDGGRLAVEAGGLQAGGGVRIAF